MAKIKIYIVIILLALTGLYLGSIFTIKDQYDNKLHKLDEKNEQLEKENKKLRFDNGQMGLTIENLDAQLQEKRKLECDCDCKWLRDFYDEFHNEVGALE